MRLWPDGKLTKSVIEVARLLGVHRNIVLRLINSGKVACTRFSRNSIHFTWPQVVEFLESCEEKINVNNLNLSEGGE